MLELMAINNGQNVNTENFLLGVGERANIVYMTDLGLAIYRHPDRWGSSSTPRVDIRARPPQYASINGHLGVAQSRRDDLEALGYMLVYFMRGRLPWQGLKAKRDAKYLLVSVKKQATGASELCAGLPTEFVDYFNYVHDLRDEDRPDYQYLRKTFTKLFHRQGFEYDNIFDWTNREFQRLGLDAEELPTSNSVNEKRGVDTAKPWGCGVQDVTEATRGRKR
ncbi:uncharacterized protein A1O9_13034 [Exophiala aquamarina CBS 119918]|uniref:Protein kinase domain-containing protein n=1 Tax=Exophiala aquamarina CBS 119918 TaxID=1182545 RepID=A0A072P5N4_9EURO|nr:uncharacterized protein A1O9_13034 [Exophiala aquamarina CBS 119918]KEF50925.1 hypothetical protein A1O9_13034 [Exophiala aquamarina CBS 119918]